MKHISAFISAVPYVLISFFTGNVAYLSIVSIIPAIQQIGILSNTVYLVALLCSFIILLRWRTFFAGKISPVQILLLIPYFFIILLRFPILHPTADDVAGHYMLGDYARTIWTSKNFMPENLATYFHPAVDMLYTPFLYTIGIRASFFLLFAVTSLWIFSIYNRLIALTKNKTHHLLITILFIMLPYIPHLMAIHGTLMVDFIALAFTLEAYYQFIAKNKQKSFACFLLVLTVLVKQSTTIFFLPFFFYLVFQHRKNIRWEPITLFGLFAATYFLRLQLETGNMLFGLYNGIFKSSLYDPTNFHDGLFGPLTNLNAAVWPIIGQFSDRYGQGVVLFIEKVVFAPLSILGYLLPLVLFLKKRSPKYVVLFSCFVFWSFNSGYSRYVIPLFLISLLTCIWDVTLKLPKFLFSRNTLAFIYICIWLAVIPSFRTDFSWRPSLYFFKNPEQNLHLKRALLLGSQSIFKDTIPNFAREQKEFFSQYEAIVPIYRGEATFFSYLGHLNGLPVIAGLTTKEKDAALSDAKISDHIKSNLSQLDKMKRIVMVVEKPQEEFYVLQRDVDVMKTFNCTRVGPHTLSELTQSVEYFTALILYDCIHQ